jgi:hypothetical protein
MYFIFFKTTSKTNFLHALFINKRYNCKSKQHYKYPNQILINKFLKLVFQLTQKLQKQHKKNLH